MRASDTIRWRVIYTAAAPLSDLVIIIQRLSALSYMHAGIVIYQVHPGYVRIAVPILWKTCFHETSMKTSSVFLTRK